MEDCYLPYDEIETSVSNCRDCSDLQSSSTILPGEPNGTTPTFLEKLFAWAKENPLKAGAVVAAGLWFLFFAGDNNKKRNK